MRKLFVAGVSFAGLSLGCSNQAPGSGDPQHLPGNANGGSSASAGSGPPSGGNISVGAGASAGGQATAGSSGGQAGDANLGGGAGSAGAGGEQPSSTLPGCELSFPYNDEPGLGVWLGGDSAYSVQLNPTTALWSFQDTFVNGAGKVTRQSAPIIANSYAWVSCQGGVQSIRYFWKKNGDSHEPILDDGDPSMRFWPQQPILYKGYLFQAMTRVYGAGSENGTTLARISNPTDPPDQWQVEYYDLASVPGLGKGTQVVGDYVYFFYNAGTVMVTRILLDQLIEPDIVPAQLIEYLANDGQWKQGLDTGDAKKFGFSANVGTSFRYLEQSKQWLCLFTSTAGWPNPNVAVATAPALEGPWSKAVNIYEVPEMTSSQAEYDKDNICYAAVEHPESNPAPDTDLLFTYTCNSAVFAKQVENLGIYLPIVVRMKNPISN